MGTEIDTETGEVDPNGEPGTLEFVLGKGALVTVADDVRGTEVFETTVGDPDPENEFGAVGDSPPVTGPELDSEIVVE